MVFFLTTPVNIVAHQVSGVENPLPERRLWVLDNETSILDIMAALLGQLGFEVLTATEKLNWPSTLLACMLRRQKLETESKNEIQRCPSPALHHRHFGLCSNRI